MTAFFAGLFRRFAIATPQTAPKSVKREGPLRVEPLEPRHQCAVEVTQECNFIVIDGEPDAGSLKIQHEPGTASEYDDKIVVTWTSGGQRQARSFDLYKHVERNGQGWAVKNIEYVETSGGRGRNKFWSQAKIASYLNVSPQLPELHAAIYGAATDCPWTTAAQPATK